MKIKETKIKRAQVKMRSIEVQNRKNKQRHERQTDSETAKATSGAHNCGVWMKKQKVKGKVLTIYSLITVCQHNLT